MNYVHLTNDNLLGAYQWKGRIDLLNIVLIGISKELPKHDEKYKLHRLLNALLSIELSIAEKLEIMEMEYDIPLDNRIREDVSTMCNLSQGILEKGEAKIILNMYEKGYTLEQIADVAGKTVKEIQIIIEKGKSARV